MDKRRKAGGSGVGPASACCYTDWKHPATPGEIITTMVVKGLIDRDPGGALSLTDRGRALLWAMLPNL